MAETTETKQSKDPFLDFGLTETETPEDSLVPNEEATAFGSQKFSDINYRAQMNALDVRTRGVRGFKMLRFLLSLALRKHIPKHEKTSCNAIGDVLTNVGNRNTHKHVVEEVPTSVNCQSKLVS